jgi:RNA polymerase sigma-70 factor (subfamily 1)
MPAENRINHLDAARQGDSAALEGLLESYRNFLRLLAQTAIDVSLQGKADPSDLVQETLMKAYRQFMQFRGNTEVELTAWLRKILVRALADLVRQYKVSAARKVTRERSLEQVMNDSSNAAKQIIASSVESPSSAAERREMGVLLADALAELSPDYQQVIRLRNIESLDWPEIAITDRRTERQCLISVLITFFLFLPSQPSAVGNLSKSLDPFQGKAANRTNRQPTG